MQMYKHLCSVIILFLCIEYSVQKNEQRKTYIGYRGVTVKGNRSSLEKLKKSLQDIEVFITLFLYRN